MNRKLLTPVLSVICFFISAAITQAQTDYTIYLKSGSFEPQPVGRVAAGSATAAAGSHIFIQFEGAVTEADKDRLADRGIHLLEYIPNLTWVAKLERNLDQKDIADDRIRWFGRISPEQKLSNLITS